MSGELPFLKADRDGVLISIKVQPRASRTEIAGVLGDELRIRVAAPPVDSAANVELLKFLSKSLGVAKSAVTLEKGAASRHKLVHVTGTNEATIIARLVAAGLAVSPAT